MEIISTVPTYIGSLVVTGETVEYKHPNTDYEKKEKKKAFVFTQLDNCVKTPKKRKDLVTNIDKINELDFDDTVELKESQEWRISNDVTADWAISRIEEEKKEYERLEKLANEQILAIQEKLKVAENRYENRTKFLKSKLQEYFYTVPAKATKTNKSYRLLNGSLVMKLGSTSMKKNDKELVEFLRKSGNEEMIQMEEKPKWAEFKKQLKIVDGCVVDKISGEIVEGVSVSETPDTFLIEFK